MKSIVIGEINRLRSSTLIDAMINQVANGPKSLRQKPNLKLNQSGAL
ncbi:hypothetical protein ACOJBO_01285 [Rhizobium beringeri]